MSDGKSVSLPQIATPKPPAVLDEDWGDVAGAGTEGTTAEDLGRPPFLRILHYTCPEVTEGDAKAIPGAKPGMILNTGNQEIYDGKAGGIFIPVARDRHFSQWHPRDSGGGNAGPPLPIADPIIAELRKKQGTFGKLIMPETGDELVDTYIVYGLFTPDKEETERQIILPFTSTQIKKYNVLMQKIVSMIGRPAKYPMWAWKWRLTTQPESNRKGKFFGWRLSLEGGSVATALLSPKDALVAKANEFYDQIRTGTVAVDYSSSGLDGVDDENIPF